MGKQSEVVPILLKSFSYDSPRAEVCCEIGYFYKNNNNHAMAFKWFDLATRLPKPDSIGFILIDCWGYIPNIECAVCLWHIGNLEKAKEYNERAGEFKPNDSSVLQNRKFFEDKLK